MSAIALTAEPARKLRLVDTPSICNALELAMGGRSAQGFSCGTLAAARGTGFSLAKIEAAMREADDIH